LLQRPRSASLPPAESISYAWGMAPIVIASTIIFAQ
jgi:hypothetical protein